MPEQKKVSYIQNDICVTCGYLRMRSEKKKNQTDKIDR